MQPTQASDDTSFAILTSASSAPSRLGPGAANLPSASSAPEKSASTTSTQTTVSVPPSHTVTWNISPQKSPPTSVKQVATTPAIGGNRLSTGPRPMEHIGDKVVPLSSPRQERLRTFEGWRSDRPLKKEDLADAGFFYTGLLVNHTYTSTWFPLTFLSSRQQMFLERGGRLSEGALYNITRHDTISALYNCRKKKKIHIILCSNGLIQKHNYGKAELVLKST